ncbi:MAG: PaaI family thioesterase [bacterium]|nr:PaaI family thioesterase [bacterium]MDE0501777.1 PaaI family thioesterase [bacterium]
MTDPSVLSVGGGFAEMVGIVLDESSSSRVRGHVEVGEKHHQPFGIVNAGLHSTMVETLASVGAFMWAQEHRMAAAVGVHNATDFFRSHRLGRLDGEAVPVHQGRSQQIWQVTITRASDGKMVAQGRLRLQNLDQVR